jgi:alpha-galactosidase
MHKKISILFLVGAGILSALDNGLAKTPPMGWNSWNKFACMSART